MLHVVETGKTIDQDPLTASTNSSIYMKAKRIAEFEKLITLNSADSVIGSDIEVQKAVQLQPHRLTFIVLLSTPDGGPSAGARA